MSLRTWVRERQLRRQVPDFDILFPKPLRTVPENVGAVVEDDFGGRWTYAGEGIWRGLDMSPARVPVDISTAHVRGIAVRVISRGSE